MECILENEYLKVTLTTKGAQIKSVVRKSDGVEHMWCADPVSWKYHSPTMFPYCGGMTGNVMTVDGVTYDAPPHGFAQPMERKILSQGANYVEMELSDSPETLKMWPFRFRLITRFTLEGETVIHGLRVENPGQRDMPFSVGYHPGFAIPFDDAHTIADYEIRFSSLESPLCLISYPDSGEPGVYCLGKNIRSLQVSRELFEGKGMAMLNLASSYISLCEKDSSRRITLDIAGFPYVLIWSRGGMDPRYVCIEPWYSLDDRTPHTSNYLEKPAAEILKPGESWSTRLKIAFER